MTALQKLQNKWEKNKFVCVGLDTDYDKIPEHIKQKYHTKRDVIFAFNMSIIDATKDIVAAYKPNTAFYERYGSEGIQALEMTCEHIAKVAPDVLLIIDAKRGDIGNTNEGTAEFVFDLLKADAITLHNYMGAKAMTPFLDRTDKLCFVLCATSNEGAGEFQDRTVEHQARTMHLYDFVADEVATTWNTHGNCGLVTGATVPEKIGEIRNRHQTIPLLIPGIGKQGGDLQATLKAALNDKGEGILVNSSREIIYASSGEDFAEAAQSKAFELSEAIGKYIFENYTQTA